MSFSPKQLWYLVVPALAFYAAPLLARDTGSGMLVLLLVTPVAIFLNSAVFGAKNRWHWAYPVVIGLWFLSTVPIFYNESASVYALIYSGLAALGMLAGGAFRPGKSENKIWKLVVATLVTVLSAIAILSAITYFSFSASSKNQSIVSNTTITSNEISTKTAHD